MKLETVEYLLDLRTKLRKDRIKFAQVLALPEYPTHKLNPWALSNFIYS